MGGYAGPIYETFSRAFHGSENLFIYWGFHSVLIRILQDSLISLIKLYATSEAIAGTLEAIFNIAFSFLKLFLVLLSIFYLGIIIYWILKKDNNLYILPFDAALKNKSEKAISNFLYVQLQRIKDIHEKGLSSPSKSLNLIDSTTKTVKTREGGLNRSPIRLENFVIPPIRFERESIEFNLSEMGTLEIGSIRLPLGNILLSLKRLIPGNRINNTICGGIYKFGSTISLVAHLGGKNTGEGKTFAWEVRRTSRRGEELEGHIPNLVRDLSFQIAYDLSKEKKTKPLTNAEIAGFRGAQTWISFKYLTEGLEAYHDYANTKNIINLERARGYGLKAKNAEFGYKEPSVLLFLLSLEYARRRRFERAENILNKIADDMQDFSGFFALLGITYMRQHKFDKALMAFEKSIQVDPSKALNWYWKGLVLNEQGKLDEAINAYDKALELDMSFTDAWISKGADLGDLGKNEEAIKCFDKAIELNPKSLAALNNKGLSLNKLGLHEEAIRAYDKALEIDPIALDPLYNRGSALYHLQKYDEAIRDFDKVIAISPSSVDAWIGKGMSFRDQKKYNEALQAFDSAIQIDPRGQLAALAWNYKGITLGRLGKNVEAIKAYEMAVEIDQKLADAWANKAVNHRLLGQISEANAAFVKAKELGFSG
jgi:tetratricopeptide (TPR) repeat protein